MTEKWWTPFVFVACLMALIMPGAFLVSQHMQDRERRPFARCVRWEGGSAEVDSGDRLWFSTGLFSDRPTVVVEKDAIVRAVEAVVVDSGPCEQRPEKDD